MFARSHGYHLTGRPEVWLVADPLLERGQVEVDVVGKETVVPAPMPHPAAGAVTGGHPAAGAVTAGHPAAVAATVGAAMTAGAAAAAPPAARSAASGPPAAPHLAAAASSPAAAPPPAAATGSARPAVASVSPRAPSPAGHEPSAHPIPAPVPALVSPESLDPAGDPGAGLESALAGIRGDGSQTLVFRRPAPQAARAVLRVCPADGRERTVEVDAIPLTIGRSTDNVLVLGDRRVSRHHGRLQARHGTLVYTDLGSTNGSRVNGIRVDEIVLGEGDRLQVGDTVLVVETLPG